MDEVEGSIMASPESPKKSFPSTVDEVVNILGDIDAKDTAQSDKFIEEFREILLYFTLQYGKSNLQLQLFVDALDQTVDSFLINNPGQETPSIIVDLARRMVLEIAKIKIDFVSEDKISQLRQIVWMLESKYGGEKAKKRWTKLISGPFELALAVLDGKTIIFSGGTANSLDKNGNNQRGISRDILNQLIEDDNDLDGDGRADNGNIVFCDSQIHPFSNGREYYYPVDGPTEALARELAEVTIFSLTKESLGLVTMYELIRDISNGKKVIFWMENEFIPVEPDSKDSYKILEAHIKTFIKAEKNARSYFMMFAEQFIDQGFPVVLEYDEYSGDPKKQPWFEIDEFGHQRLIFDIYKDRFSADVLMRALIRISNGLPTKVIFHAIAKGSEADISQIQSRVFDDPTMDDQVKLRKFQMLFNLYKSFGTTIRKLFLRWYTDAFVSSVTRSDDSVVHLVYTQQDAFSLLKSVLPKKPHVNDFSAAAD